MGKAGNDGSRHGEDDAGRLIHEIGCKDPNVVYLGSAILWNVTRVTITP